MLNVYPNPFTALGPDGLPCGRVYEFDHPRPYTVLGGKIKRVKVARQDTEHHTKKEHEAARRLDTRGPRILGVADVKMRPLELQTKQYFKERIGSGDLIAADKRTAEICGIPAKEFKAPLDVLKAEMAARVAEWTAINGAPPALADYVLVQNGDEIALAKKDAPVRPKAAPVAP